MPLVIKTNLGSIRQLKLDNQF